MRLSQIGARLLLHLKRRTLYQCPWLLARRYAVAENQVSLAAQPLLPCDRAHLAQVVKEIPHEEVEARLVDLKAGRFSFLNRTVDFGERICWDLPGESRLWRYNLHYFDYAWDLILADALRDDGEAYCCFQSLVEDWILQNPLAQGVGWHAYPVALRAVNWIYAALAFDLQLAENTPFRQRFMASIYTHCRFLADHLEWESRGNHILENGKSLLTAGLFFHGAEAERWLRLGSRLVWQALDEQILSDGGHYERSPMYHAIVLQDYLEIVALYRTRELPLPSEVESKLRDMVDFFAGLRHPDGGIPLLGDSAFGIAPEPEDLLPVAAVLLNEPRYKWPGHHFGPYAAFLLGQEGASRFAALPPSSQSVNRKMGSFPNSGYFMLGDGKGNALILDGKGIHPDEVPAHGHCNVFGYELSVNGQRVIVDSGVETYDAGPWRDYYRNTRAHNALMVDGIEQSETWSAFRVARRARVRNVRWNAGADLSWYEGVHDGFARTVSGLLHRRLVVCVPGAFWLIADRVWGASSEHKLESFVHLHPDVTPVVQEQLTNAPIPIQSLNGNIMLHIVPFGFREVDLVRGVERPIQGWYAPEFGQRFPNSVLVLNHRTCLPHLCGYVLMLPSAGLPAAVQVVQTEMKEMYTISTEQQVYRIIRNQEKITLSTEKTV